MDKAERRASDESMARSVLEVVQDALGLDGDLGVLQENEFKLSDERATVAGGHRAVATAGHEGLLREGRKVSVGGVSQHVSIAVQTEGGNTAEKGGGKRRE